MMKEESVKEYQISVTGCYTAFESSQVLKSEDVYNFALNLYDSSISCIEKAYMIMLNRSNKVIGYALVSIGGIDCCFIDKRVLLKYAIDTLASSVILVHNHPSGSILPSRHDDLLTKSIKEAFDIIGIEFVEHLIITPNEYYSYSDRGRISFVC